MIHIDFIFNSSYLVPGENMKTNILNVSNHIKSCFMQGLKIIIGAVYYQLYHCYIVNSITVV